MTEVELIFESECDADIRTQAWTASQGGVHLSTISATGMLCSFDLHLEDAEAMARAILGIPSMPEHEWNVSTEDVRALVLIEQMRRANEADRARGLQRETLPL